MGIYEQPNSWQCGPFALKHALLTHGVVAHEDALAAAAGSSEAHGTDEQQLERVAQEYGCRLLMQRHYAAFTARRALEGLLAERVPVLLCVDQWDHWVTAVAADANDLVVFDSHFESVVRVEPWGPFLRRVRYRERLWSWGPPLDRYDLHPLVARGETGVRLTLTPERARRLLERPGLRRELDRYAERFAPIAVRPADRRQAVSVAAWLDMNRRRAAARMDDASLDDYVIAAEIFGVYAPADRLSALVDDLAGAPVLRAPAARAEPLSAPVTLSAAS